MTACTQHEGASPADLPTESDAGRKRVVCSPRLLVWRGVCFFVQKIPEQREPQQPQLDPVIHAIRGNLTDRTSQPDAASGDVQAGVFAAGLVVDASVQCLTTLH